MSVFVKNYTTLESNCRLNEYILTLVCWCLPPALHHNNINSIHLMFSSSFQSTIVVQRVHILTLMCSVYDISSALAGPTINKQMNRVNIDVCPSPFDEKEMMIFISDPQNSIYERHSVKVNVRSKFFGRKTNSKDTHGNL